MDDLLREFLTETNEGLALLDVELVQLEQNPNDAELLGEIFRLTHTIKGTCGFLGLPRLESVAHAGENVLGRLRDGDLEVTPEAVSLILECLDRIRSILSVLEDTEKEPEGDDRELIVRLNALCDAPSASVSEATDAQAESVEALFKAESQPAAVEPSDPAPAVAKAPEAAPSAKPTDPEPLAAPKESSVASQSIRVNVDVLENLMTMVSEMVLTRNQLLQILRSQTDSEFAAPLQQLNHVVSELQEGVMKTRMQPIGNAWAKLPRIVRDLSHELGKKIELVMKGADTELDRQVLELIKDPLTHMVRNSADHGLETPEQRRASDKSEGGTITLNAFHEGGHIIIEISDDGRGLPIDKIKEKCIANDLASEADLESLTDQKIMQHIFKADFSTATEVTAVSGRGVGMDVVRTNIEKIGGTVELSSIEGKGTKFLIKIPLTLAIVSALIVESGGERFAIPQLSVVELVRASSNSEHSVEWIKSTPVLRLRNRLLPLVSLCDLLKLGTSAEVAERQGAGLSDAFIVVAQVGNYNFGIIVDRVFDTEEIVVKPVAPILRNISLFCGNTILGDGRVVMILDPNGISAQTGEIAVSDDATEEGGEPAAMYGEEKSAMLLFRAGGLAPKAVPLGLVARLEEIDRGKIETSEGQRVVQYRGQLMPLVSLDGTADFPAEGRQPILVFADGDRSMGLVVDQIIDIVEDHLKIELSSDHKGFLGSAIIDGKATDVIDAGYVLTLAFKDWFKSGSSHRDAGKSGRILLVDDSPFFRNLLTPLLKVAGYEVTALDSADRALELCERGEDFDVIISDIEMPGMSGFEFAETVRSKTRWSETPMVALSSHTQPDDLARGHAVGFTDYVPKLDREALLSTLYETLNEVRGAA